MRKTSLLMAAVAVLGASSAFNSAFAAQQLAAGAATSCKVNSTNPQTRAIQMAMDPFGVFDFQFSCRFDPRVMSVAGVSAVNGYVLGHRTNTAGLADFRVFDFGNGNGVVSVSGYWPGEEITVPQDELDVFTVDFVVATTDTGGQPVPNDATFAFQAVGVPYDVAAWRPDFFRGVNLVVDEQNPTLPPRFAGYIDVRTDAIIPSPVAFAQLPEPGSAGLLLVAGLGLGRRRR